MINSHVAEQNTIAMLRLYILSEVLSVSGVKRAHSNKKLDAIKHSQSTVYNI